MVHDVVRIKSPLVRDCVVLYNVIRDTILSGQGNTRYLRRLEHPDRSQEKPESDLVNRWKLDQISRAANLHDLAVPPGNRRERLKGRRSGQSSIRINDQHRI